MTLSKQSIGWLKTTLLAHHSSDPSFFRPLKGSMTSKAVPWRCRFCRKLAKASASFCPHCGVQWERCFDQSYTHQQSLEEAPNPWNDWSTSWQEDWDGWEQRPKSPRRRASPRTRKGKGKGKEKGKAKEDGPVGPFAAVPSLPSLPAPPALPPSIQGTATPTAVSPFQAASSKKTALQTKEEQELQSLRSLARTLKAQTGLSEEVVKALNATEEATQKEQTKSYRDLITALGNARKSLADIDQEWTDYRTQWANYMDTLSRTWVEQAESFEKGEEAFTLKRQETVEKIQELRARLNTIHQKTMHSGLDAQNDTAEAAEEIAQTEDMEVKEDGDEHAKLQKLKTRMTSAVLEMWFRGGSGLSAYRTRKETCQNGAGGRLAPILHASEEVARSSDESRQRDAERMRFRCLGWARTVEAIRDDGSSHAEGLRDGDFLYRPLQGPKSSAEIAQWKETVSCYHDFKSPWLAQLEAVKLAASLEDVYIDASFIDETQSWTTQAVYSPFVDGVCDSVIPHVFDRWCDDLLAGTDPSVGEPADSPEDDLLHLATPQHLEWRPPESGMQPIAHLLFRYVKDGRYEQRTSLAATAAVQMSNPLFSVPMGILVGSKDNVISASILTPSMIGSSSLMCSGVIILGPMEAIVLPLNHNLMTLECMCTSSSLRPA